jgi:hypothetical protein
LAAFTHWVVAGGLVEETLRTLVQKKLIFRLVLGQKSLDNCEANLFQSWAAFL